jgi:hypothetical protein
MTENGSFFSGEVVSNIWWVQILQENLYPNIDEYDFTWRSRTQLFEVVPNYLGTISPGYDLILLGTTSPEVDFSLSLSMLNTFNKFCLDKL